MEKYLICLDLDGTLLNKKSKISFFNKMILKFLMRNGSYVILNSGRPYQGMLSFIRELKLFNYPFIASNGGGIYYINHKYEIVRDYLMTMDDNKLQEFFESIKDHLVYAYFKSEKDEFYYNKEKVPPYFIHHYKDVQEIEISSFSSLKNIIAGSFAIDETLNARFEKNRLKGKYSFLNFLEWKNPEDNIHYYDFAKSGVNKGATLLFLANKLKIKPNNIIAFGDDLNDLSMLKITENGYLMKQSQHLQEDNIKIMPYSNEKSGVGKFLFKYFRKLF